MTPQSRPRLQGCQSAGTVLLIAALVVGGGGCGREGAKRSVFLTRPEPGPSGRLAFVSQSRVWITDASRGHGRAVPLPLDLIADRPRWMVDSTASPEPMLALNVWSAEDGLAGHNPLRADLALWNGTALEVLGRTPESEILDDAALGGRLLFERNGMLCEAAIERSGGSARLGPVTELVPGRDGRYTPDGRHLLFVRGHESDPLGIWHQGYQGGDDSEVYHLDLLTRQVTQVTDNPDNDEQPIPLDDLGRRFIVCRERGGLGYRPWIVEVITAKKHRVRRLPMPEGPWPVLFPAVRWLEPPKSRLAALVARDTTLALEVWAEADGDLIRIRGKVQPAKLAFPPPERVRMQLVDPNLRRVLGPGMFEPQVTEQLWQGITSAIEGGGPFVVKSWRAFPQADRDRFQSALATIRSETERTELILRLLGRLGARGFAYAPPGEWSGVKGVPPPPAVPPDRPGAEPWVYDLRGIAADSSAGWNTAAFCGKPPVRPGVILIDEKTVGEAEFVAALLRRSCQAILIGRTTSGVATYVERSVLSTGAVLTVPATPRDFAMHDNVQPSGVAPDLFVPAGASEEVWQAAVNAARERLRK